MELPRSTISVDKICDCGDEYRGTSRSLRCPKCQLIRKYELARERAKTRPGRYSKNRVCGWKDCSLKITDDNHSGLCRHHGFQFKNEQKAAEAKLQKEIKKQGNSPSVSEKERIAKQKIKIAQILDKWSFFTPEQVSKFCYHLGVKPARTKMIRIEDTL